MLAVAGVAVEAGLERGRHVAQRVPAPAAVVGDGLLREVQFAERLAADCVGDGEPDATVCGGLTRAERGHRLVHRDAHRIEVASELCGAPRLEVGRLVADLRFAALAYARPRARGMATERFFMNLRMTT